MDIFAITSQEILDRISRHCPESMSAYLQCLNRQDQYGKVIFTRKIVEDEMSESYNKFRKSLKKLFLEGLLEWHPEGDNIVVIVAPIAEELEDYD